MKWVENLSLTAYDRLKLFYQNISQYDYDFTDYEYKNFNYKIPKLAKKDKNLYRKYLRVPMKLGNTKQYNFSLYGKIYRFYRGGNNFYFIDSDQKLDSYTSNSAINSIEGFCCSMAHSHIAMAVYELINWLTGSRNNYNISISDEVFYPIFDFPQWECKNYDCRLDISYFPKKSIDSKTINLSIFK